MPFLGNANQGTRPLLASFLTRTRHLVRMQRPKMRLALLVIGFLGLAECGNLTGRDGPCTPTITASSGTTPQFSWSPSCKIQALSVVSGSACDSRFECWAIESVDNGISPPVRYGTVPSTAGERFAPIALQVGHEYLVRLERYEDVDSGRALFEVSQTFTP